MGKEWTWRHVEENLLLQFTVTKQLGPVAFAKSVTETTKKSELTNILTFDPPKKPVFGKFQVDVLEPCRSKVRGRSEGNFQL